MAGPLKSNPGLISHTHTSPLDADVMRDSSLNRTWSPSALKTWAISVAAAASSGCCDNGWIFPSDIVMPPVRDLPPIYLHPLFRPVIMMNMPRAKTQLTLAPPCDRTPLVADPLTPEKAVDTAKVFKALADPIRLRLLSLIASHGGGEVCVCDLIDNFDVTAPTISFHLKVLREAGLVESERRATWVYYWVNRTMLAELSCFFAVPALTAAR